MQCLCLIQGAITTKPLTSICRLGYLNFVNTRYTLTHAAAVHEGPHVEDVLWVEDLLGGDRADAAVGDGRSNDAGALACQLERAELF